MEIIENNEVRQVSAGIYTEVYGMERNTQLRNLKYLLNH